MSESLEMTIQPGQATREASAPAHQTRQIVAQGGVARFYRVGLALVGQGEMVASPVAQAVIQRELVTVVLLRRGLLDHLLSCLLTPMDNSHNSQKAVGGPVHDSHDVGFVFFSPMKVNSSSCSATSTGWSGPGKLSGKLSAYAFSQLATEPGLTPT